MSDYKQTLDAAGNVTSQYSQMLRNLDDDDLVKQLCDTIDDLTRRHQHALHKIDVLEDRIEELEAKLSKAVEALSYYADHEILYQYDDASFAKDTITELKGQKEELKPKGRGPWPNAIRAVNYRVGTNEDGTVIQAHRIEQYHEGRWTAIRVYNESEDGTLEEEDQ